MLAGKKISQISAVRAGVCAYMDATLRCSRILSLSTAFKFTRKTFVVLLLSLSPIKSHVHYVFLRMRRLLPVTAAKFLLKYINTALLFCPLNLLVFLDFLDAVGVTYIMNQRKAVLICAEM